MSVLDKLITTNVIFDPPSTLPPKKKMELITTNLELIPVEFKYRELFTALIEKGVVAKWRLTLRNGTKIEAKTAKPTETKVPPFSNGPWSFGAINNRWEGYNTAQLVDEMVNRSRYSKFWNSLHVIELYQTDSTDLPCYRFSLSENGMVNTQYRYHYNCKSWDQHVTYGIGGSDAVVLCKNPSA